MARRWANSGNGAENRETFVTVNESMIPSAEYLESVELRFSVHYPRQFKTFCGSVSQAQAAGLNLAGVEFIRDFDTFREINTRIGEGEWGDYERAVAGLRHPKNGNKLWGKVLPFAFKR
jgi:hypothetical protein